MCEGGAITAQPETVCSKWARSSHPKQRDSETDNHSLKRALKCALDNSRRQNVGSQKRHVVSKSLWTCKQAKRYLPPAMLRQVARDSKRPRADYDVLMYAHAQVACVSHDFVYINTRPARSARSIIHYCLLPTGSQEGMKHNGSYVCNYGYVNSWMTASRQ